MLKKVIRKIPSVTMRISTYSCLSELFQTILKKTIKSSGNGPQAKQKIEKKSVQETYEYSAGIDGIWAKMNTALGQQVRDSNCCSPPRAQAPPLQLPGQGLSCRWRRVSAFLILPLAIFSHYFLKVIFYWLCHYSCPDFPAFAPLHLAPPTPSGNPPTIVHVHGSCV